MKTYLALTLDGTPAWFGYSNGTGHVIMSTVITQGGDHIGGNPTMQPACPGSKPMDAWRAKNGVTEKFLGDKRCKRCETWLKSLGAEDALAVTRDAAYAEENAVEIAELGTQSKIAELVSDGVWKLHTSPRGFLASAETRAAEGAELIATVLTPEPLADDESADSTPLATSGLPKHDFPPAPGEVTATGILANEAAFVRGKSQSSAPADRTMHKPGNGKPAEISSYGTLGGGVGRDHLDESVREPRETVIRKNGVDVGDRKVFATTHPDVAEVYGVTVRKYESKSPAWQREYRRKLARKSAAAYAADAVLKAEKKAEAAAKRAAAKIAKDGK